MIFVVIVFISIIQIRKPLFKCQPITTTSTNVSTVSRNQSSPYLAYIIAFTEKRFNATFQDLTAALPGFFKIQRIQSVSHNDSRLIGAGDMQVASLLLTHISIWNEIGSKPDTEVAENDWVFVFEDDVNVVPINIMRDFHGPSYKSFTEEYPNPVVPRK